MKVTNRDLGMVLGLVVAVLVVSLQVVIILGFW